MSETGGANNSSWAQPSFAYHERIENNHDNGSGTNNLPEASAKFLETKQTLTWSKERSVQSSHKAYPPQQRKFHADASEYYDSRHYQQESRIPYAPYPSHSNGAVESESLVGDSRDEVPFDKHRQQQTTQDQGMLYKEPEQFQYTGAYPPFSHEASYPGYYRYYHHPDAGVHPWWAYGVHGSYSVPFPPSAHPAREEGHEEYPSYRPPPVKIANRNITESRSALLFMICDGESLSEYQCLIRKQIELFSATSSDIELTVQGRNRHIEAGQVGVRCRHCADLPIKKRARGAVYYPSKLSCIYQAAQNMAAVHLTKHCTRVPSYIRTELLKKDRKSSAGSGKEYWAVGARTLGVVEVDGRLWFGDNVLTSQQEFGPYGQY